MFLEALVKFRRSGLCLMAFVEGSQGLPILARIIRNYNLAAHSLNCTITCVTFRSINMHICFTIYVKSSLRKRPPLFLEFPPRIVPLSNVPTNAAPFGGARTMIEGTVNELGTVEPCRRLDPLGGLCGRHCTTRQNVRTNWQNTNVEPTG